MLLKLFIAFFQIGLLSVGGGYAALAYINDIVVVQNGWLTQTDFTDLITLSQMTPGPLAINAATFVGTKVGGIVGAIIATIAFVLPAVIIVLALSMIYYKYKSLKGMQIIMASMRIVVIGLIASVCFNLLTMLVETEAIMKSLLLMLGVVILRLTKINPIYIILLLGVIYIVVIYIIRYII